MLFACSSLVNKYEINYSRRKFGDSEKLQVFSHIKMKKKSARGCRQDNILTLNSY